MNKSRGIDALPNTAFPQDENNFLQKEITYSRPLSSSCDNISYPYGVDQKEMRFLFVVVEPNLKDRSSLTTCKSICRSGKAQGLTFLCQNNWMKMNDIAN